METIRAYFKSPWRVLVYLILCLSAFLWLVPVITGLITSLRTYDETVYEDFIVSTQRCYQTCDDRN